MGANNCILFYSNYDFTVSLFFIADTLLQTFHLIFVTKLN